MAILDKLTKKKETVVEKPTVAKKAPVEIAEKKKPIQQDFSGLANRLLKKPHITERSSMLARQGQYVFVVHPKATKIEIAKAVASLYKVKVVGVNVAKNPKKARRVGRHQGFKSGLKKAIVTLKEGDSIDIFSV